MRFEEMLPELRADKKVRRSSWADGYYIALRGESPHGGSLLWWNGSKYDNYYSPSRDDFNANDWEIVEKKVKLRDLTEEQYCRRVKINCDKRDGYCGDCPFTKVVCTPHVERWWFYHQDIFNEKFLDQEIEVE